MNRKILWIFFSFSVFMTLLGNAFLPHFRLYPLTAFVAYVITQNELKKALCYSFLCGLVLDLFTTELPFGSYCVFYMISTTAIYAQKWLFFHDKFLSLPIYTFVLSFLISSLIWITKSILGFSNPSLFFTFFREGLLMPLFDGLFALIFYSLPLKGLQTLKKKGLNFYFLRKLQ